MTSTIPVPLVHKFISFISATLIVFPILYLIRKWLDGGKCCSEARLDGKTVIVTGANVGIGKETAIDMLKRGATVVIACRSRSRGESALFDIKKQSGNDRVFLRLLDLASLKSVRDFTRCFSRDFAELHILINNAGVFWCPYAKTEDGFEMHMGVNHLGHFALTNLLLPMMVKTGTARIVNVSARGHYIGAINFDDIFSEKSYSFNNAYCNSKLANLLFTKELHRKLQDTNVTSYSLHPGVIIKTDICRHIKSKILLSAFDILSPLLMKSVVQGAQTSIYCAVEDGIEKYSGLYFSDCAVTKSSKVSHDEGIAKKLWELSENLTGVTFPLL